MDKLGFIDLHVHLDGSVSAKTIIDLAKQDNVILPTTNLNDLERYISVGPDCDSLNKYLQCFDIPLSVLQTKQSISKATEGLILELDKEGLIYAEIRFAPQLHMNRGLSQREVVQAAILGMNNVTPNCEIKIRFILCCMRGNDNIQENIETVEIAREFINNGVVAVDLAGAEAIYKTEKFQYIFDLARDIGVPFTIHAGEADGATSVRKAIEFGARRIGHGIRACEDLEILKLLRENDITLEMCPTSNLQTKVCKNIKYYPIKYFLSNGIKATVNTDNMTVSKTTLDREFELLQREIFLTSKEIIQLEKNAVYGAFISQDEKEQLMKKLETIICKRNMDWF